MADTFDVKQWLSSLKTQNPNIEIPKEAEEGWLRQSDYDRNLNRLKQEHAQRMAQEDEFHDKLKTAEDKIVLMNQLEAQYGPAATWTDTLKAAINTHHPELQEQQSVQQIEQLIAKHVTPLQQKLEQAENQIKGVGTGASIMIDFMSDVPERFRDKYGSKFPKKEFSEFFQKSGTNDPFLAYELFEKPFLEKHLQDTHKSQLEEAEKRGYQSAMSKHGVVEIAPTQQSGMLFKGQQAEIDPATGQPKPDVSAAPSYEERKARVGNAFMKSLEQSERSGTGSSSGTT